MRSQADPQSNRKSSIRLKPDLVEQSVYLQPESDVGARDTRLYHNHPAFSVPKLNFKTSSIRPQTLAFFWFPYCAHAQLVPTWRKGQMRSRNKNVLVVLKILTSYQKKDHTLSLNKIKQANK